MGKLSTFSPLVILGSINDSNATNFKWACDINYNSSYIKLSFLPIAFSLCSYIFCGDHYFWLTAGGSDKPLKPCCEGREGGYKCGDVDTKGNKQYTVCQKAESAFFWDDAHPSHAGWSLVSPYMKATIEQILWFLSFFFLRQICNQECILLGWTKIYSTDEGGK